MANSKIISASIAVDIKNLQEVTGAVQGLGQELSNMKVDKNLEPRLKNVEKTLAGAVQMISEVTNKIDVLSQASGVNPKTLTDLAALTNSLAETKIAVDALEAKFNNLSNSIKVGDVGVKQITNSITSDITNMTSSINDSLSETASAIKRGGKEIVESYNNLLEWIKTEKIAADDLTNGDAEKAIEIFKIEDVDDVDAKIKKVKQRLQKDLKDFAEATKNFNNAKLNNVDNDDLEKYAEKQAEALDKLKESFTAFYNYADLDHLSGVKVPKAMQNLLDTITVELGGLEGKTFKTFEEIYDFIDVISKNIEGSIVGAIKSVEGAMEEANKAEVLTERKAPKKKADTKKKVVNGKENNDEIRTGVVIKEGTDAELIAELKTVIDNLQKFVNTHPIELDAVINPTWGTTQTTKYLKSIREQLSKKNGNIDEKLAERIYGLQDAFGKDFSDALNRSIEKLKTSLSKEGFTVGKLKIEDSTVSNFKQQLTDAIGEVEVNVLANIQGIGYENKNSDPELLSKADALFDELRNADKYDNELIKELVNLIKENNLNIDFSDAYKDQIKNIVKGLVDGTYMSIPEAIMKNKGHWGETPQGEFTKNRHYINELIDKINNTRSPQKIAEYQQELTRLYARNQEIVAQLMSEVKDEEETQPISEITQQAEKVVVNTSNATININNGTINGSGNIIDNVDHEHETPNDIFGYTKFIGKDDLNQLKIDEKEHIDELKKDKDIAKETRRLEKAINDVKNIDDLLTSFMAEIPYEINYNLTRDKNGKLIYSKNSVITQLDAGSTPVNSTSAYTVGQIHNHPGEMSFDIPSIQDVVYDFIHIEQKIHDIASELQKGVNSDLFNEYKSYISSNGSLLTVDYSDLLKMTPEQRDDEYLTRLSKFLVSSLFNDQVGYTDKLLTKDEETQSMFFPLQLQSSYINEAFGRKTTEGFFDENGKWVSSNFESELSQEIITQLNQLADIIKNELINESITDFDKIRDMFGMLSVETIKGDALKFFQKVAEQAVQRGMIFSASGNTNQTVSNTVKETANNIENTVKEIAEKSEATLVATRDELVKAANQKFAEILAGERAGNLDFDAIDTLVKDLRLAGIDKLSSTKLATTTTTGRIVDAMLKGDYASALEAFRSTTSHSDEAKARALEVQQMSKFFERFQKLYAMQTIQKKGTGSEKSIQMFVDAVRKSGVDFKVDPKYQDNEIGKLINSMLTRGYKTVADAINANKQSNENVDNTQTNINGQSVSIDTTKVTISSPSEVKITGTQRIAEATQKISNATIEITNGKSTTNTVEKDKTNKSENKPVESNNNSNKNIDNKSKKLLDEYNNNVLERGNLSFGDYLYKQGQILSKLQNNNVDVKKSQTNSIKHYQQYVDEINKIINTTTDNILKEQLIQIRTDLIDNVNILNAPVTSDNIKGAQDAIQNVLKNINAFDKISTGLELKAKEINTFLTAISKIDEIIYKGKDKNLSKSAQETILNANKRAAELKDTLMTAQKNNDYSEIDIESIRQELFDLRYNVGEAINQTVVDKLDIKKLVRKLDNLQIDEVKADPTVISRVKQLRKQLQNIVDDDAREMLTEEYNNYFKEVSQLSGTVSKSDRTFFGNFMKEWRHKNYQMMAQFFSFYDIIRYMREAVNVVKQYDTALIEMMKVSDETRFSLERYQQTLFDTADAIGSSALTLEQSTADWMRIGESLTEAAESAKAAQILMNVSEFQDINSATQALVSASQAYAELDKMEIVDKINKLGNEFPIATDQLATALQNSAAALTTQGNSLEEALALVVGGNIITQDALKTGTGIRTIALRIAGTKEAKDELAELGEGVDDFVVRTESKTRKLIMDYTAVASNGFKGVDIYNDNGNLRSTYEIMQDIADIYKEIQLEDRQAGTNRANALVELLAGKNRSNIAASILTNPDTIREAYEAAQNAEGSAMRENEKYLTSVEAHITMFKNAVDELITSLIDSGFINEIIDFGTTLVNLLKEITDAIGGVGTALAGIGIGVAAKMNVITDKDYGLIKSIKTIANQPLGQDALMKLYANTSSPEELMSQIAGKGLTREGAKFLEVNNVTKDIEGLEEAIVDAKGATNALSSAWQTVGFSIAAIVSTVIIAAIANHVKKIKEAQKATREYARSVKEQSDSIKEYAKRIADAKQIIDDERSSTDEVREAKNQLLDIQNELNDSYDIYTNKIKDSNTELKKSIELLKQEAIENARKALGESYGDGGTFTPSSNEKAENAFNNRIQLEDKNKVTNSAVANLIRSLGIDLTITQSSAFLASSDYETLGKDLNQAIQILSSQKYENSEIATQARNVLSDALTEYNKDIEENKDLEYNRGMVSVYDTNREKYNLAVDAYLQANIEPSEENKELAKKLILELWKDIEAAENTAGMYWAKQFFKGYEDAIEEQITDKKFSNEIYEAGSNGDIGEILSAYANYASNGSHNLSAEQIKQYLEGNYEGVDEQEKQYLDDIARIINENNIFIDELIDYLINNGSIKTEDRLKFEDSYNEQKENARKVLGMSEEDFDALNISNDEELTKWKDIIAATNDAKEAVRMYYLATAGFGATLDSSTILKNMQEQYKPAFDALAESYKEIFDDKNNYKGISKITAEKLQGVNAQFEEINKKLKEAGLDIIPQDAINSFLDTLSTEDILDDSFTTKAEEVHAAYNNIATTIVDSLNPALGQASFETVNLMTKQLKQLGVTNAEEVIFTRLGYTIDECSTAMDTYAAAKEAADAIDLDLDKDVSEFTAEEWAAISSDEAIMEYYRHRARLMAENISTVEDVQNLVNLTKALGDTTVGAIALAEAISRLDTINANTEKIDALNEKIQNAGRTGDWRGIAEYQQQIDALKKENADVASSLLEDVKYEAEFASSEWDGNEVTSSTDKGSESKQKFDWIERAIKKIQRAVTNLGKVADATYKTWGERLDAIMGKTEEFHDEIGQFGRGNIDLYNRPVYRKIDENGDEWTETTFSHVEEDEYGRWVLVPRIARDDYGNAYEMSEREAWGHYEDTGEYLGIFDTIEEANEYAEKLHLQQEAIYDDYDNFTSSKYQKLKEEIALQEQASQAYMAEAKAIGLSAEYVNKIQNGKMDIETVTDEKLKEAISDYQEYYDKATDAADAVEDLRGEIAQLAQTKFDMITKQFEEMALAIDHAATRIGHIQSKMEAEGYFESSALIKQLKAGNEAKLEQLKEEALELAASIDEAVTNGDIEYGSEQWWGMYDSLQNVNDQIVEMSSTIADLNDQLRQMEWDNFDYIADAVHRLVDENEFLIDVLQDESLLFEKNAYIGEDLYANGNMSDAALAVQGLHVNSMQVLEQQNEKYANEIKKINAELANDPNNKKLLERRNDLIDQQQDIIKGITSEKQAIKELIKEGYETFLDYLQKSIDYRKKALEAQKNLYDYQNTVEDQTKTISSYRKQLAALGGDDSEENQARLQTLADNLNKAEKELQQTEYERWLSDQEEMMDNLYDQFDKLISDKLDQTDELIRRAVEQTESSSKNISDTITSEFSEFLYELDNTSFGVNMDDRMSNAISAVNSVENAIGNMVEAANVNAQNELRALEALAQTVADSAVQRPSYESQVPASTGGNGGNGGNNGTSPNGGNPPKTISDPNYDKKKNTENSRRIRELNEQLAALKIQRDKYKKLANGPMGHTYIPTLNQYENQIHEIENTIKELSGFAKGGTIGKAIKKTGEDGIILARSGEEVLSLERVKQMQEIFKMMQPLTNMGSNSMFSSGTTVNGMNVSFDLPNVANYEDFVRQAKSDPTFEKLVQSMTIGASLGKSKLSKYSI